MLYLKEGRDHLIKPPHVTDVTILFLKFCFFPFILSWTLVPIRGLVNSVEETHITFYFKETGYYCCDIQNIFKNLIVQGRTFQYTCKSSSHFIYSFFLSAK